METSEIMELTKVRVADLCVTRNRRILFRSTFRSVSSLKGLAESPRGSPAEDLSKEPVGKYEMIGAMEIRESLPAMPVGRLSKKTLADEGKARRAG
jgi:hypothetical protein